MLAALAGHIYDHAPQQNAIPLDNVQARLGMLSDEVQKVLSEAFADVGGIPDLTPKMPVAFATFDDAVSLAEVIARDGSEEELQQVLTVHPGIVLGAFGYAQNSDIAFVTKPAIGNRYRADFGILSYDQGGCSIHLIEIESAGAQLFTRGDTPARTLQAAMGQVRDWDEWLRPNQATFVRDLIDWAKALPEHPAKAANGSFKLMDPERIEGIWRGFGGYNSPGITYTIVVGRWSQLSQAHKDRLLYLNRHDNALHRIYTYDQLLRRSHARAAIYYY